MNIFEKLQTIRVEMNQIELKRTGYNKNSNFAYYELKDFLPTIMMLFEKHKLYSKFDIQDKFINDVGIWKEYATLKIVNIEAPDEVEIYETPTAEVMIGAYRNKETQVLMGGAQPIQNLGGKHSYLKRYLYQNAVELTEADSVDRSGDVYEVYNGINITVKEAKGVIIETYKFLYEKLKTRVIDVSDLFTEITFGGKLKDASITQLLRFEKELAKANVKNNKWFSKLYNTNSRGDNATAIDEKITYQTSLCRFAVIAYTMADEDIKDEVLGFYQKIDIDIIPFLEV